jgi:hypothetical protein
MCAHHWVGQNGRVERVGKNGKLGKVVQNAKEGQNGKVGKVGQKRGMPTKNPAVIISSAACYKLWFDLRVRLTTKSA